MELSKQAIDDIKFTKRHRRCYDALEVDVMLDTLAAAAEKQAQELQTLRLVHDEYVQVKKHIAETLLMAQRSAESLVNQTKQACDAELSALSERKNTLQNEIAVLEQYKAKEIERIQNSILKILGQ